MMTGDALNELTMVETPFLKQLKSLGWKTVALDEQTKQDPQKSFRNSPFFLIYSQYFP